MIAHAQTAVVLAAVSTDSDAYRAGRAIGVLLFLALGATLLVVGLRRRRSSAGTPPQTWVADNPAFGSDPTPSAPVPTAPAPAPGDYFAPAPSAPAPQWSQPVVAPPPSKAQGGIGMIVAGAVVLLLGLVGGASAVADLSYPKRTIGMPDTLLGEPKNAAATASVRSQFVSSLPSEIKTSDLGVFGAGASPDLIVIAGTGHLSSPDVELAAFRKGVASNRTITLSGDRTVAAGALGGKGRCYDARIGTAALEICAFADRGSLLATLDRTTDPVSAAARALQVRELVIHRS